MARRRGSEGRHRKRGPFAILGPLKLEPIRARLPLDADWSYQPINGINHQQLLINIDGDIQLPINNLDNKNSDVLEPLSVLFTKPIDINRNQLIMYDNVDVKFKNSPLSSTAVDHF